MVPAGSDFIREGDVVPVSAAPALPPADAATAQAPPSGPTSSARADADFNGPWAVSDRPPFDPNNPLPVAIRSAGDAKITDEPEVAPESQYSADELQQQQQFGMTQPASSFLPPELASSDSKRFAPGSIDDANRDAAQRKWENFPNGLPQQRFGGDGSPAKPKPKPDSDPTPAGPIQGQQGLHPLVDRQLDGMDKALQQLKEKRTEADEQRQEMSEERADAMAHMNDAVGIQREEVRAKDIERAQEKTIKRLKSESSKLQASHDSLFAKLDMIMEPKVKHAKKRLKYEAQELEKAKAEAEGKKDKAVKAKEKAVLMLRARRDMHKKVRASEEALAEARKVHEEDEKRYRSYKTRANGQVEAFRWADTELRAALDSKAEREAAEVEAESSVKKLQGVLDMETKRIDQALAAGKMRLDRKVHRAEMIRDEAGKAAELLRDRYATWQEIQRKRASKAAEKANEYRHSLKSYADQRREIFDSAQAQAGEHAESVSDWAWDDWAWSSGGDSKGAVANPVSLEKPLEQKSDE